MYPTPRSHRPLIMGRNGARSAPTIRWRPRPGSTRPRRRQRGRCRGRDLAGARRRRADDVGARRRRLLSCLHGADRPARTVFNGTGPAPRPRRPSAIAAGIPIDGPLQRFGAGLARRRSARCTRAHGPPALGASCAARPSRSPATASPRPTATAISPPRTARASRRPRAAATSSSSHAPRRPRRAAATSRARSRRSPPTAPKLSIAAASRHAWRAACATAGIAGRRGRPRRLHGRGPGADRGHAIAASRSARRRPTRPASSCCRC